MEDNSPKPVSKHAKKITIIVVAIIVAIAIGAGTIAILRSATPASDANSTTANKDEKAKEAKNKYDDATALMKKGDSTGAKKALEDAQSLYNEAGDSSHDKDIESSLSTLNKQNETQPAQTAPAASEPANN